MGPTGAAMDKPITAPEASADSSVIGELLLAGEKISRHATARRCGRDSESDMLRV